MTLNRLLKENVIYRPCGRITAIYKQYCMGDCFHMFFEEKQNLRGRFKEKLTLKITKRSAKALLERGFPLKLSLSRKSHIEIF
jgi:hypothetical protein